MEVGKGRKVRGRFFFNVEETVDFRIERREKGSQASQRDKHRCRERWARDRAGDRG